MLKNKITTLLIALTVACSSKAQTVKLDAIIDSITAFHPVVKMYNNEIRSMGGFSIFLQRPSAVSEELTG